MELLNAISHSGPIFKPCCLNFLFVENIPNDSMSIFCPFFAENITKIHLFKTSRKTDK